MRTLICVGLLATVLVANVCHAGPQFVAKANIYVDPKAVDKYISEITSSDSYEAKRTQALAKIREDINYNLVQTNKLLNSLSQYGFSVEVRVKNLTILTTNVFTYAVLQGGDVITDGNALKLFSDFLIRENAYFSQGYDFAMLWTGFNLFGPAGTYTTSVTKVGGICDPKLSIAIVEFNGTYITSLTTAQSMAYLMGASSDGAASDNIMAPANYPGDRNRWNFTQCTATDILQYLSTLTTNCLLVTGSSSTKPTLSYDTFKSDILNPNTICKRYLNTTESYTCKSSNLYNNQDPKGDLICKLLYCHLPSTSLCSPAYSSDGLICDYKKRCDRGKCVADSSAASENVDSSCVLGDQEYLEFPNYPFYGTCQQFVAQEGSGMCYNDVVRNLCCATCNKLKTTISNCEYRDRNKLCPTLDVSTSCAPNNKEVCCYTCRNYVRKRSAFFGGLLQTLENESRQEAHKLDGFKAKAEDFFRRSFLG